MYDSIGKRIKAAREALGLSQYDLAQRLGVNQSTVALWEKDRTTPRHDKVDQLSRILILTREFILFGSSPAGESSNASVPVIGYVGASDIIHPFPLKEPQMMPAPPAIPGRVDAPTHAVIVLGNDLWPVYRDGDILFFSMARPLPPEEVSGQECIVEQESGEKVMKRVVYLDGEPGTVLLSSFQGPEMAALSVKRCMPVMWTLRAATFKLAGRDQSGG